MSDNTQVNTGSGDVIRDIDRTAQGIPAKTQVVQLDAGGESAESLVSGVNPLPVADPVLAGATSSDAPLATFLVGDPNGDFAGVKLLEEAMTDGSGFAINVKQIGQQYKVDANNALVLSDAVGPFTLSFLPGAATQVFDTTGYSWISATTGVLGSIITPTWSNDGINFSSANCLYPLGTSNTAVPQASLSNANTSYVIGVAARYVKFPSVVNATVAVLYFRTGTPPLINVAQSQNLTLISGSAPVNGGVGGTFGVGGIGAPGGISASSNSGNPVQIAGTDSGTPGVNKLAGSFVGSPTLRTVLLDNTGRLRLAEEGAQTTIAGTPALNVQDSTQFEGQSIAELLAQILFELRVANQQRDEFSRAIQTAGGLADEPAAYRAEQSIFIQ